MSAKTNIMYEYGAQKFWKWFKENEDWINNSVAMCKAEAVLAVDKMLNQAFPDLKGKADFLLGFFDEKGEFYFHHWGNKELIGAGRALEKLMPTEVAKRWQFFLDECPPFFITR